MQRTLCAVQCQSLNVDVSDVTQRSLQRLVSDGLVTRKQQPDNVTSLDASRLGKAVYKGNYYHYYYHHHHHQHYIIFI